MRTYAIEPISPKQNSPALDYIEGATLVDALCAYTVQDLFPQYGRYPIIYQALVLPKDGHTATLSILGHDGRLAYTQPPMEKDLYLVRGVEPGEIPAIGVRLPWGHSYPLDNPFDLGNMKRETHAYFYGVACGLIQQMLRFGPEDAPYASFAFLPKPANTQERFFEYPYFDNLFHTGPIRSCLQDALFSLYTTYPQVPNRYLETLRALLYKLHGFAPETEAKCNEAKWALLFTTNYFYQKSQISALEYYVRHHPKYGKSKAGIKKFKKKTGYPEIITRWRQFQITKTSVSAVTEVPEEDIRYLAELLDVPPYLISAGGKKLILLSDTPCYASKSIKGSFECSPSFCW